MLVNVFDITNEKSFRRYDLKNDKEILLQKSLQMSNALFVPPNDSNRAVYVQNFEYLCIEDIFDGERLNFDRVRDINQILENLKCGNFKEHDALLNDFFKLQLNEEDLVDEIKNIILVHDDFGPESQEHILGAFPKDREQTTLLWRSVAVTIGAEDELKKLGAKEFDKVLIIDKQNKNALFSILTLKTSKRNKVSMLVPQRKLFKENSPNYDKIPFEKSLFSLKSLPKDVENFYNFVFSRNPNINEFFAPYNGSWQEFKKPENPRNEIAIDHRFFVENKIKHCIIIGNIDICIPPSVNLIHDKNEDLLFYGVCKFAYRKENKFPTYLDHCEALSIVVQSKDECIITETLIDEAEDVLGGEEVIGKRNEKCFIEKQNSNATFYLFIGDNHSQLKELIHDFGKETEKQQKLVLEPRMQPGQGIARVFVDASPLIYGKMELNFREMQPSPKTLEDLQKEIKRSFPIDMPLVKADNRLWYKVEDDVRLYLKGYKIGYNLFTKAAYINPKAEGIEKYERKNVFGMSPKIPSVADKGEIEKLFSKINKDYKCAIDKKEKQNYVKLAAWTYAGDTDKSFEYMTNDILENISSSAENSTPLARPYFTYCSNFLTLKENVDKFYQSFCHRVGNELNLARKPRFGNWIYGLANILTFNNNFFEIFKNKKPKYSCEYCMNLLFEVLKYAIENDKPQIFISSVSAMLFLLKYRKYEPTFLRKGELYDAILEYVEEQIQIANDGIDIFTPKKIRNFNNKKLTWLDPFKNYLTGDGTIDGIPMIDADDDSDDD